MTEDQQGWAIMGVLATCIALQAALRPIWDFVERLVDRLFRPIREPQEELDDECDPYQETGCPVG